MILSSPDVLEAMQAHAIQFKIAPLEVQKLAQRSFDKICGEIDLPVMAGFSWVMRKIWRRLYENIHVDQVRDESGHVRSGLWCG